MFLAAHAAHAAAADLFGPAARRRRRPKLTGAPPPPPRRRRTALARVSSNPLRLNPTKTQFIWFGTRQQLAKIDLGSLAIKYPHFTFSSSVRDLGVTLDQEL